MIQKCQLCSCIESAILFPNQQTMPGKAIKYVIRKVLGVFNLDVHRRFRDGMPVYRIPKNIERLDQARRLGFKPRVVFDGGAFQGLWAREVNQLFPDAQFVLIEANKYLIDVIGDNTSAFDPPSLITNVAIGEEKGDDTLNVWSDKMEDQGASLLDHVKGRAKTVIKVKVDTLDHISRKVDLLPDLVKLDLQGAELMALKGAHRVLKHAEMFIIEFGCLEAYENRATPRDVISFMYANDYCLYDIAGLNYRPYDGALNGGDLFFVKNTSALRQYKGWK